jgi:hypothetical protein
LRRLWGSKSWACKCASTAYNTATRNKPVCC